MFNLYRLFILHRRLSTAHFELGTKPTRTIILEFILKYICTKDFDFFDGLKILMQ